MQPEDSKRMVVAVLAFATFGALHPSEARAEQHIVCPLSKIQLDTAAPILGPVNGPEPWGELHGVSLKKKDGTYINKYDLAGGVAPQLEKWLICYYRDGSYKPIKLAVATKECGVHSKQEGIDPATKKPLYRVLDITCN